MKAQVADLFLFVVAPYFALAVFCVESVRRARRQPFTITSLSSQFLEDKSHFWGSVPFHYGLLVVLALHLTFFLLPRQVLAFNAAPARVFLLEATGLAFALLAAGGLAALFVRRAGSAALRVVTTPADWVLLALLGAQLVIGAYVACARAWGSSWFAASLTPYLRSLLLFSPDISYVAWLPWAVKAHIVGAFLIVAVVPFTRLIHALAFPLGYFWRRPQVVRWSRPRSRTCG
ncbi:MAG: respiratory nitrate reductase subunit gamma [Elusimicrobia bacterium]|nr:respiratory nitrate reductase subunit gamma [Elusimicrobiota bacterium]